MEMALDSLENKLKVLKEFLPRADPRRGLINAGGPLLKVADLDVLHSTVDDLHRKEDAIVHSLNQQVTYLKLLDGSVKSKSQATGSLTNAMRGHPHTAHLLGSRFCSVTETAFSVASANGPFPPPHLPQRAIFTTHATPTTPVN
jgi:hypothetical protein